MLNPCCGCLCEEHAKTSFHYDLTASWGMVSAIQKCPRCNQVYPKPLIRESDLERFWEEIDGHYHAYAVKGDFTCEGCGTLLSLESDRNAPLRTYECGGCGHTFDRRGH